MFLRRFGALVIILGSLGLWVFWVPLRIQAHLPLSWRSFLDRGDTPALITLFIGWPLLIALLACAGAICAALLLRPFVSRSQAEHFINASPFGGHIGSKERAFLRIFRQHGDSGA